MKRLLVLLLVLGLTTAAGAVCTSLQISVNGVQEPVNGQYGILPSDYAVLDIWTNADIVAGTGEGWFAIACNAADATISGGISLWEGDAAIYDDGAGAGVIYPPGENGPFGQIGLAVVSKIPAGSTLFNHINFHSEQFHEVIITLYQINDDLTVTPLDSVTFTIPEPATMLLFGLGSLFLRRRK